MGNLLRMLNEHEERKVPVDTEAAWLHHRFVQIHPFQDGNGRVARALASLLYIRAGYFPPAVTLASRPTYFDALNKVNQGDLKPFVDYLANLSADKMLKCMDFAQKEKDAPESKPRP
jgi:Fic family protein